MRIRSFRRKARWVCAASLALGCGVSDRGETLDPGAVLPLPSTPLQRVALEEEPFPVDARFGGTRLEVPAQLEPWTVRSGRVEVVEPDGSRRRALHVSGGEKVEVVVPGPFDLNKFSAIYVGLTGLDSSAVAVRAVLRRAGEHVWQSLQSASFGAGEDARRTLRFPFPEPEPGRDAVDELSLILKLDPGVEILVEDPTLEQSPPPRWRWAFNHGNELSHLPLGRERRMAYALSKRTVLSGRMRVARRGLRLIFGYGASSTVRGRPIRPGLLLTVRRPSGDETSTRLPLRETQKWLRAEVPLAGDPGEELSVRVELVFEGKGEIWAAIEEPALCAPDPSAPAVVLVTSDTHRADHLGASGSNVGIDTPALDELAARGLLFENCFASIHITLPSHAAMFTGTHPLDIGLADNNTRLADEAPTLAEAFQEAGYATLAATSLSLLSDVSSGLGQGFDRLDAPERRRDSSDTIELALEWLDETRDQPLFLWVHLFDAHSPYRPPAPFDRKYARAGRDPFDPTLPAEVAEGMEAPHWLEGARDAEYVRALYRGEIAYEDFQLARLLDHPRLARAVVAVTADHGESLGGHGIWWQHKGLYPDTLHVPLILAWPGAPGGRRVDDPVRHVDLGRTLLDLADLGSARFPGRNLLASPPSDRPDGGARYALASGRRAASINLEGWHLILTLAETHRVELYDTDADPACERDLVHERPEKTRELHGLLVAWLGRWRGGRWTGERRTDPAALEQLAELGYADSTGEDEQATETLFPDGCDCEWCGRLRLGEE